MIISCKPPCNGRTAKGCSSQLRPDKSTVRRLDQRAALEAADFNLARPTTFTRMAGLQCLLYQLGEPFVQQTPNFPSGLRTEGPHQ
jgi:hypothetical protein